MSTNRIDFKKLFSKLRQDDSSKKQLALNDEDIKSQIDNLLGISKDWLRNLTVEEAVKAIVWYFNLTQFGTYGNIKDTERKNGKVNPKTGERYKVGYSKEKISRGKIVSVDFGVSNIGKEIALLHLGVVVADYTGIAVVVPLTSQNDDKLKNIADDITKDFIPITKKDYNFLDDDSFILPHQIRSISKNRITGIIGSISKTKAMFDLELKLYSSQTKYINKKNEEEIEQLKERINHLQGVLEDYLLKNKENVDTKN